MPWHEVLPMDQRLEMMREYELGLDSMAELANRYGLTAKTGFKWLSRYRAEGVLGLLEQSRRPHGNARAFPVATRALLLEARRAHPTWGADKLLPWVAARQPEVRLVVGVAKAKVRAIAVHRAIVRIHNRVPEGVVIARERTRFEEYLTIG